MIIMFGGNFAPRGWASCDGQLLSISSYSALFSILGTTYGGDGRSTFGLPDLSGRVPMHTGTGAGLTSRSLGAKGGIEKKKLTVDNMPAHNHDVAVTAGPPDSFDPAGGLSCKGTSTAFDSSGSPSGTMKASAISSAGGGKAVNNMQPFAVVQYIIALQGVYPSRS